MKTILFVLLLAALNLQADNLIKNPGFEETDASGKAKGWNMGSNSDASLEITDSAFSGKYAAAIRMERRANLKSFAEAVLSPGFIRLKTTGKYVLSFRVKLEGDGSVIALWYFRDKNGEKIAVKTYWLQKRLRNTGKWEYVEETLEIPESCLDIRINLGFRIYPGGYFGCATFDDVSFMPLEEYREKELKTEKELFLDEDFSKNNFLENWQIESGSWAVEDGVLHARGPRAVILCRKESPSPNLRIDYTAWSDSPCDLSAITNRKTENQKSGYFFGIGSNWNTVNKISDGSKNFGMRGGIWETLDKRLIPGKEHHISIIKNNDELQLFLDGNLAVSGNDEHWNEKDGKTFGFYVWSEGWIDNVKAYALPCQTRKEEDVKPTYFKYYGFEENSLPKDAAVLPDDAWRIENSPTWGYKNENQNPLQFKLPLEDMGTKFASDRLLAIDSDNGAEFSIKTENGESQTLEFDLLAEQYGEIEISLCDGKGRPAANLYIAPDGTFMTGEKSQRKKLRDKVRFQRRVYDAPLKFTSGRWHTFRLSFDNSYGVKSYSILDYYRELKNGGYPMGNMGDILTLGNEFNAKSDVKAEKILISAKGKSRLWLDNIFIYSPSGNVTINGKPASRPAREIFGVKYPLRKDAFRLKYSSTRHVADAMSALGFYMTPLARVYLYRKMIDDVPVDIPVHREFRKAATLYNRHLIGLVFLEERLNMLERSALYLNDPSTKLDSLRAQFAESEKLQETALQQYANAYMDDNSTEKLGDFYKICAEIASRQLLLGQDIDTVLQTIRKHISGQEIAPCPLPTEKTPVVWNRESKRFEQNGNAVIYHRITLNPCPYHIPDLELMGYPFPHVGGTFRILTNSSEPEEYMNKTHYSYKACVKALSENKPCGVTLVAGTHYPNMAAPEWWIRKHWNEDDVWFYGDYGLNPLKKPYLHSLNFLNYWNSEVEKLIDKQYGEVGKFIGGNSRLIDYVILGAELKNMLPDGTNPGYNPSAISAFRSSLEKKYGLISTLNEKWNTHYRDFTEISPCKPGAQKSSALTYEFNKFFHEGFTGWLEKIRLAVHRNAPDALVVTDQQETFGGHVNINPPDLFQATDMKLYHTFQAWDRKLVCRWHYQLSRAYGIPWGNKEWTTVQASPYMYETGKIRNSALTEFFLQMMWGQCVSDTLYSQFYGNWQYESPVWDPVLDYTLFSYVAGAPVVFMDRARRIGYAALTAPAVKPEIGILESTTSYYLGTSVRNAMAAVAEKLASESVDFEVLYEQTIMEKRQHLQGLKVLFVANAPYMRRAFVTKLLEWMVCGGIVIASGDIPGIMDEHGIRIADHPFALEGNKQSWHRKYEKGEIHFFPSVSQSMFTISAAAAPKQFGSENCNLQFCMREKNGVEYLYAVNCSEDIQNAVLFANGRFKKVTDCGLQLPLDLKTTIKDDYTCFNTRLAPGEGTLFELHRENP